MGSHTNIKNGDNYLHQRRAHSPHNNLQQPQSSSAPCYGNKKGVMSAQQQLKLEEKKSSSIVLVIPRWLYCYMPAILVVALSIASIFVVNLHSNHIDNVILEKIETFGWEMVDLFGNFDQDGDVHLNFEEALPLIKLMSEYKKVLNESGLQTNVSSSEEILSLKASFTPLVLSSMTKDWSHDLNNNFSFHGLFKWTSPNVPLRDIGVSSLRDLLPHDLHNIPKPGHIYEIISPPSNIYNVLPSDGRSTRHFPPQPAGRGRSVHSLLSMFHPRPFVIMRFSPQGAYGCVRAVSKTHVHVLLRIHAEFQLNEPPRDPFWFTPAQFAGSLLMTRDGSRVEHFHLYVPADRHLNVDMEWLTQDNRPESMEVDIGYLPHMEIVSVGPSKPQTKSEDKDTDQAKTKSTLKDISSQQIKWRSEISEEAARDLLAQTFYPFKQIKYHNFSEAFNIAATTDKLVHSILLWGALDDQSC